jgi:hypothetical protein
MMLPEKERTDSFGSVASSYDTFKNQQMLSLRFFFVMSI